MCFFKPNSLAVKCLLKWEEKTKNYHDKAVKNKKKNLAQFSLGVINFFLFRIIKRITALLAFKEHLFFDTSQSSVQNQDSFNKGTREENGNIATNAYSKESENQGICGTQ